MAVFWHRQNFIPGYLGLQDAENICPRTRLTVRRKTADLEPRPKILPRFSDSRLLSASTGRKASMKVNDNRHSQRSHPCALLSTLRPMEHVDTWCVCDIKEHLKIISQYVSQPCSLFSYFLFPLFYYHSHIHTYCTPPFCCPHLFYWGCFWDHSWHLQTNQENQGALQHESVTGRWQNWILGGDVWLRRRRPHPKSDSPAHMWHRPLFSNPSGPHTRHMRRKIS